MKTLILLRHGKSDWSSEADDRERPLTKRGRSSADAIGAFLTGAGEMPDAVVTSPARRAADTAARAAAAGTWTCRLRTNELLYGAEAFTVLDVARSEPDTTERLMLVGHEPTSSDTLALIVGGGRHRFPTAAAAGMDLDIDRWADISPGCGLLHYLVVPRMLGTA
jgi:phosphohistidine phosphatase